MTFYDQDGSAGPEPEHDPDIWSVEPEPPARPESRPESRPAQPAAPRPARRRPPGEARPPRPGAPRRPAAGASPAGGAPPRPPRRRPRPEEDEYIDLPDEARVPRWLAALLVVGLVIVGIVGGGWWWYQSKVNPSGAPGDEVTVAVPEGATTSKVASILEDQGVISSAMIFNFYVGGKDLTSVQAGSYVFRTNSSFDEAIRVLNAGPDRPVARAVTKVTIPEGYRVDQIVARINEKVPRLTVEDLQAALDTGQVQSSLLPPGTTNYEGLLFPATYEIGEDDTAVEVLTMMAAEMESRVNALGIDAALAHVKQQWGLDLTAYDVMKVASMIQYEAAIPADGPKIGAVTYNRLEQGTPLGYDSTSIYEAALGGQGPEAVDYEADTPYNTRTRAGLPPTPIAAPGEYAITGAFQPEDGDWLYFVLTDTDEVTFTVTYDDFLAAKQLCIERNLGCG